MPHPLRTRSLLSYALAIMAAVWPALAVADGVALVISNDTAVYREVASAVRRRLEPDTRVFIAQAGALDELRRKGPQFIVAIGNQAARAVVASDIEAPILVTLLPKTAVDRLADDNRRFANSRPLSAVYLDQPIGRQLDLVRLILPNVKRVGALLGPESAGQFPVSQAAVLDRKMRLVAQRVAHEGELAAALQKLLPEIDVLLALPDPAVFNAGTIQTILLATYRLHLPLVGFSAAYVQAGAIASLHSTPVQIGEQAADMLASALANSRLPPPQYPRQYSVATNPYVARSLGILVNSEEALLRELRSLDSR